MKKLFKALFKTAFFRWLMCVIAAGYIRFVHYTSRKQYDIPPEYAPYGNNEASFVLAFWHGRMLLMPMLYRSRRHMHVLISTHRDGEMIARTMHRFGFSTIRGSSTRGGREAAMQSVRALKKNQNVAFTPDGPKGPALKLQPGVVIVAKLAKVPVIPMTYSATKCKRMRSWDRFLLPLPFGKVYYKIGKPMFDPTPEALENEMVRMNEEVDIKAAAR